MRIKIHDVAEIYNGSTPSTSHKEYYNGNIVWITPKDLSDQRSKYVRKGSSTITELGYKSCSTKIIPANNILLSSRAPIGLIAINLIDCCTNQGFKSFVVDKQKCDVNYLYYYLIMSHKKIESLGAGTTFKEVSKLSIENFVIDLPNMNKQIKIAKILSKIDALIEINNLINDNLSYYSIVA